MRAIILTAVPGLPDADLIDVADGIGAQLVNNALVLEVTHSISVDLIVQVVELADQSATVETKSDRLQLLQGSIVEMLVAWVLLPVVHLFVPDADLFRHVFFEFAYILVLWEIE